jgi:4-amino-4-deoxychorismate lyase
VCSLEAASRCLVNGEATQYLTVFDRGLQFGDGVFETVAVRDGRLLWWQRHLQRLSDGCERLGFTVPEADLLYDEAQSLVAESAHAALKIMITRGNGMHGYHVAPGATANRILLLRAGRGDQSAHSEQGIRIGICQLRLADNPTLAGIKHLNRLEQVLARRQVDEAGWQEGIMLDQHGNLVEGTMSNLFLVRDGLLMTPPLERCGIRGITRDVILEIAAADGIATEVRELQDEILEVADELFVCNSLIGIWPVIDIAGKCLDIGPLTRRLQRLHGEALCSDD